MGKQKSLMLILVLCPLVVGAGLFLGSGWTEPLSIFSPGRRGILEIRLWRIIAGALVGSSLSVSGVILQAVLRNPLAEPYVLGLSSGAGLGSALCIIAGGMVLGGLALPAAGFIGAVISLAVVYQLAKVGRATAPHTLVLAGVVWSALCGSLLMFVVSQSSAEGLHAIMWWFLGDLQVFDVKLVATVFWVNLGAMVLTGLFARDLNVLLLGEEMAGHVGLNAERSKRLLLAMAAVMAAASVSVSGLISFVGLTVPHAARALVGADHRRLIPASALLGAAFLVLADGLGRVLFYPVEVPVGVVTAFVGAPFFLFLLRRRQRDMWSGRDG